MKESFVRLAPFRGCLNFKWTLLSSLIYKNTYHAQFHTVIPGDSIPPEFLQGFLHQQQTGEECTIDAVENTATQLDPSTILHQKNSDEGRNRGLRTTRIFYVFEEVVGV